MNVSNLAGLIPQPVLDTITPDLLAIATIDGPLRLSNFLGQCMEETGIFTRKTENLNYSAQGLANTWPSRYAVDPYATPKVPNDLANNLAHNPEAIANNCYALRMGNGDEASGEGWKYRGEGDIELTGKDAYQAFQSWLQSKGYDVDIMSNPDLVATAPYDLLSAIWFFTKNNLWVICDRGIDSDNIAAITEKVNGGETNLNQRIAYTQKIYAALTS